MYEFLLSVFILIGLVEALVIWATVEETKELKSKINIFEKRLKVMADEVDTCNSIIMDTRVQLDEEIHKRTNDYMCHMRDMQAINKKLTKISREIEKGGN